MGNEILKAKIIRRCEGIKYYCDACKYNCDILIPPTNRDGRGIVKTGTTNFEGEDFLPGCGIRAKNVIQAVNDNYNIIEKTTQTQLVKEVPRPEYIVLPRD